MGKRTWLVGVLSMAVGLSAASAQEAGRVNSCEAIIDAPVEQVWAAFTVEDQIESWMVPVTSIDLRIGGEWRTSYNPASSLDDADTIIHTILAFEPGRMIAVKTRPPAAAAAMFGGVDFSQLWSVFRMEPVDGGTRVTVTGLGYGEGEAWDRVYDFFKTNNPFVLEELARHFGMGKAREPGSLSPDGQRIMDLLGRWVGGEWIHESAGPGGGVFRVRNLVTHGPDGVSLLCQGWLGNTQGMMPHSVAIVRRAVDGGVVFENVNENGDVARGRITLDGENGLRWDWRVTRLDGSTQPYDITMQFGEDQDSYAMQIAMVNADDAGGQTRVPMVDVSFRRVDRAPEEFLRTSPQPAHSSGADAR